MKKRSVLFLFFLTSFLIAQAQETDPVKLQEAIDSKTFEFVARQATGMRGRSIQVDPGYSLNVSPENVLADLPFFGRAYQSTPGDTDGGMKFDFSEYTYEVKTRKKGGWDITIEPTEQHDIRSVFMTVQKTGNASLRITSDSREGISYTGIIQLEE